MGGGWKCPQGRMATEANWGQCRGYQSWQILFLTSFSICRAFEKSPMLYSFAVRGRRSHLLSPRKIISFSVYENPNFVNFWVIWTICTSNESWEHSEFKFDMKKCNLLWKIKKILEIRGFELQISGPEFKTLPLDYHVIAKINTL